MTPSITMSEGQQGILQRRWVRSEFILLSAARVNSKPAQGELTNGIKTVSKLTTNMGRTNLNFLFYKLFIPLN
jgi:hypothetical protein